MVMVTKKKGESDDRLISRFRKKVLTSGILIEFRERDRFKKDSEKRKEKKYRLLYQKELEKKRGY